MTSLGAHAALIAILAIFSISATPGKRELTLSWAETNFDEEFVILDLSIEEPEEIEVEEWNEPADSLMMDWPEVKVEVPEMLFSTPKTTLSEPETISSSIPQISVASQGKSEGESGSEEEAHGGATGTFFGISIQGQRIVFVLDASASMNKPLKKEPSTPAEHLVWRKSITRWERLIEETQITITSLNENVEFSIIFFRENFWELPPRLRSTDPETKKGAKKWVDNFRQRGKGNTKPLPALVRALQLNPDVIFFLTDGKFDEGVVHEALRMNEVRQRQVIFNTIGIGDPGGNEMLKLMAQESGGEFVFIDH